IRSSRTQRVRGIPVVMDASRLHADSQHSAVSRGVLMYSKEDNLRLTQTVRGTPMGELLRRYWWPIGVSAHLRDKPTFVRLLSEDLVLYRLPSGTAAVLGARCPHRGANLCLGHVDQRGLRCRYHGWLYDADGRVLETPGEKSDLKNRVHQTSYPVEELGGLI